MAKEEIYSLGNKQIDYSYFPTSFLSLDTAIDAERMLGIRGRGIAQFLANPGCGKSSLAYAIIGEAQRKNKIKDIEIKVGKETHIINAVFVDVEKAYDPEYAAKCGVETDKLLVVRANGFNELAKAVEDLLEKGVQLFVYDSLPATVTESELEKDMDDPAKMAETANNVSRWLIRLIGLIYNANALFIVINQYRANLSPMARKQTKPFGPKSLEYYSWLILEGARVGATNGVAEIEWTVTKNKQGPKGNKATLYLQELEANGFDVDRDIVEFALSLGVITKSGAWYKFNDVQAQGIQQCKEKFDMDELREAIEKALAHEE